MKYEFKDLMNEVIETDSEWLNKKLNGHICFGGGGGSSQASTPQVAAEYRPASQEAGSQLQNLLRQNKFGQVAGLNENLADAQQSGLNRRAEVRQIGQAGAQAQQDAMAGKGLFGQADLTGMSKELARQAGIAEGDRVSAQMGGNTPQGSARGMIAKQAGRANLEGQLANLGLQDLSQRRDASAAARSQTGAMQKAGMADIDIQRAIGTEQQKRAQLETSAETRGIGEAMAMLKGIPVGSISSMQSSK
jgi:hypothetical protein